MLYTRNATNLLESTDLGVATSSALDQETWLSVVHTFLNYTQNGNEPIVLEQSSMDGFCEQPNDYTITTTTPRIAVFCPRTQYHEHNPQLFTWYSEQEGTQTEIQCDISEGDSIVFLRIQGDKLVFNDKIVRIACAPPIFKPSRLKVYFTDLFGLPQSMWLQLGGYTFGNETEDTISSYQGQRKYELGKHPFFNCPIGEGGISDNLKLFVDGLVASNGYIAENMGGEVFSASLLDMGASTDSFFGDISVSGVLQVRISDIDKIGR